MEKVEWKIEGMTCSNCALTISKYLNKQGLSDVRVNALDGEVSFITDNKVPDEKIKKGIERLGYQVAGEKSATAGKLQFLKTPLQKFWFCFPFTLVSVLSMLPRHAAGHWHWLMNPWIQLSFCIPVFITGMNYFGKSAINSIRGGMPDMNVLIALGAAAAFVYSLIGTVSGFGEQYLYYDSAATIITLVFLGYWMEDVSVSSTQRALKSLSAKQKVMANMIAFDEEHREQVFPVENTQLRNGDLILIKTGEQVPADCKILWGACTVNESIVTGESMPVEKNKKELLIGGSILETGTVKAQVTAAGSDTVLARIIQLAKQAQADKPPIQQLADKISAVFVPAVLAIALLTVIINFTLIHLPFSTSLMRGIAVLVIACPCAMGIATPAAIAVGLGRAAKNGILFKDARSLELFKNIQQVVFDKTGTLTSGKFRISAYGVDGMNDTAFKEVCYSLEKYSNHPVARCIAERWKTKDTIRWKNISESKGLGVKAIDKDGNIYVIGSNKITPHPPEEIHSLYVLKNGMQLGWIDVMDETRAEAKAVISYFKAQNVRTVLLSGDTLLKCKSLSDELGIDETYAEQSPAQKMNIIAALNHKAPTAMVGDGINDAAALAKSTIGISLSDASHIAVENAQVILMNDNLKNLPLALGLGRHTFITIKENLFWAFFYNIIAIPIAAAGFLSPGLAALAMGFSDVILAANSVRLSWKKVV